MKTHKSLTMAIALAGVSLVGGMPTQLSAKNIQEEAPLGQKAMKEGDWAKAQGLFEKITKDYSEEEAKQQFGGMFGAIYYNKGISEMKLASALKRKGGDDVAKAKALYKQAGDSFSMCYKFPSVGNKKNPYETRCLVYNGQALQESGDFAAALKMYEKFLKERKKTDKYSPALVSTSMAICSFKKEKPDLKEGMKFFEIVLKNKTTWKVPEGAIVSAFQAFTQAVIKEKNEAALVDFLSQNRGALTLTPYKMSKFSPFFQQLATEALQADMPKAAYALFGLVPSTKVALNDLQVIKDKLAVYPLEGIQDGSNTITKAGVDKKLAALKKVDLSGDPAEVLALTSLAFTLEKEGNPRAAFAVYQQLELYFNKSKRREGNLFNLIRLASLLDKVPLAVEKGQEFRKKYPASKYASSVSNVMLSTLFSNREYEKSEKIAEEMLGTLEVSTPPHDICLYILGGSKFYLGKFDEAGPLLAEHIKTYPESQFKIAAMYTEASNLARLNKFSEAAGKLDAFIKKYPNAADNAYLPFALFDRAKIHSSQGEVEQTLALLNRISTEFVGSNIESSAYTLKGSVLRGEGKRDESKASYLKAIEIAEKNANNPIIAESLYKLVTLVGAAKIDKKENPNVKDAVPFYDRFMKDHASSPYKAQVAKAGVPALVAVGRTEEALKNFQVAISELSKEENPIGLDRSIKSYTRYFLQSKEKAGLAADKAVDELKQHYYNFPGVGKKEVRTNATLRMAVIGAYEKNLQAAKKEKNQGRAVQIQGRITSAFKELKNDFPLEQLSSPVLVRVGDYLRAKSASPRQALPYYEERLKRPEAKGRVTAEFGLADVYSRVGNAAEMDKAISMLRKVIANSDVKTKEGKTNSDNAAAAIVKVYGKQENWKKVVDEGKEYLKDYSTHRTAVTQLLATAYEKREMFSDAIARNMGLYSSSSDWRISVPAISRATELIWENGDGRDGKSRQQIAYETAYKYLKSSRAAFEENKLEMPAEVREGWLAIEKRVKKWEASGVIQTFQQMQEAK